jgi:GT2 family glycosyltransferase
MPTLDLDRAAQTMRLAQSTAGLPTAAVILVDYKMRGAVGLSNALFKAALHLETPFVIYLNDDTIPAQQDWCSLLIRGLRMNSKYGMACPSGECSTTPQRSGKPGDPFEVHVVKGPLAWFCAAIRRQALVDVGLFDENFIHYGDESDWIQRARKKGWAQIWVKGVYIRHLRGNGQSNNQLRQQWAKHDKALYRRKWVNKGGKKK